MTPIPSYEITAITKLNTKNEWKSFDKLKADLLNVGAHEVFASIHDGHICSVDKLEDTIHVPHSGKNNE